ncbi:hypothetical protein MBLNU230_g6203t1 [Neophaeotheca triangularis]
MSTPNYTASNAKGGELDQVFQRLKEEDEVWLEKTLRERVGVLDGERQGRGKNGWKAGRDDHGNRTARDGVSTTSTATTTALSPFDITTPNPPPHLLTPHINLIRSIDWSQTSLGAMDTWSPELRCLVNMMVTDPRPGALWLGPSRVMLYNAAYIAICAQRHPHSMGKTVHEAWPELVPHTDFYKGMGIGEETGRPAMGQQGCFFVTRNGYLEELYASWTLIPIPTKGVGCALYNTAFEVTKQALSERRMSTLLRLGQCTSAANDRKEFWAQTLKGLEPNRHDVPFAAVYAAASRSEVVGAGDAAGAWCDGESHSPTPSDRSSTFGAKQWSLQGVLGLPQGGEGVLPQHLDSDQAAELLTPLFRKALRAGTPKVLSVADGTFPKSLVGVAKSRAYGDACTSAVLCAVGPTNRDNILGFMLVGINPRRAYDQDYAQFIQLLTRQMGTSLASMVLIEDELRRSRIAAELAAQDRMKLSQKLNETTEKAKDIEDRFRNMADLAPVSMFHFDELGNVLYANENWFRLTQHPRDAFYPLSWYEVIHEDDHALMDWQWARLGSGEPVQFELRLKRPFDSGEMMDGEHVQGTTWIIAAAYPEKRPDGSVKGILGCLTDISRQKWAENFQERRTKQALELKRQQEAFMDITSHEARNPLSAIIMCAESLATTFGEMRLVGQDPIAVSKDTLESQMESAEIIMACAQHQKRIIDDVLTLSKLDSGLLLVTPVEVQPAEAVKQSLKMFDSELQKADIQLSYSVDDSYRDLDIHWVRLDPSRLLQVLINLLTNAIKFTSTESTRRIHVTLGASATQPSSSTQGVQYLSNNDRDRDRNTISSPSPTPSSTSHSAQPPVYLSLAVTDTGRGLSKEEMALLFQRFQQANPKTHIEYGGSGLGLFISRELVRLQGGQMGVASTTGQGSTFAFYVRGTRCAAPAPPPSTSSSSKLPHRRGSNKTSRKLSNPAPAPGAQVLHPDTAERAQTQVVAEAATESSRQMDSTAPSSEDSDDESSGPRHLLVVEDNLVNQRVMCKQLERAGYIVSVANHGVEALEFVRKSRFYVPPTPGRKKCDVSTTAVSVEDTLLPLDAILMDVEMPIMDGLTCARRIRSMQLAGELRGHVPIVAVTANARMEQQRAAREAGMDEVVTKPFRMGELIPRVEGCRRWVLGGLRETGEGGRGLGEGVTL